MQAGALHCQPDRTAVLGRMQLAQDSAVYIKSAAASWAKQPGIHTTTDQVVFAPGRFSWQMQQACINAYTHRTTLQKPAPGVLGSRGGRLMRAQQAQERLQPLQQREAHPRRHGAYLRLRDGA